MKTESWDHIDTGTYVRQHYNVPAEINGRVVANGKPGTIVGFDGAHVLILLDGEEHARPWHPTWEMVYEAATPAAHHLVVTDEMVRRGVAAGWPYTTPDKMAAYDIASATMRRALTAALNEEESGD